MPGWWWGIALALAIAWLVYVHGQRRFEEGVRTVINDFDDLHVMLDECVLTLRGLYSVTTGNYTTQEEMEQWIKRAEWLIEETRRHVEEEEVIV